MKATYPGNRTDFDTTAYIGGNGRFYRPVSATYDDETDSTVISYEPIPLEQMPHFGEDKMRQAYDRAALIELYDGSW